MRHCMIGVKMKVLALVQMLGRHIWRQAVDFKHDQAMRD